ncbi:alkaline phosphatase family protein [Bdellovibrio svalbardensis]|uniref:Alkaline phosphatase family protein n=1 Tax=Bdellovibrio svalbardensis TaxID=2972972 RepID=A0ABT6DNQ0_9BACT|nr:alkaline phosphatase family protein [Bdellovibrio svalbardensis]MDG0818117.1 alkaline phosphatase family protein [Bdellovibrio svalbardensis]
MKRSFNYSRLLAAGMIASSLTLGAVQPAKAFNLPWKNAQAAAPAQQVQTIVLAVDGFSYFAFQQAQRQGLFKEFTSAGAHVAPFPSMTDLSWSTITNTADLFGAAGRIKSVEATYFDESSQSVQGDPRDYYRRLAFPKYYMGAFDAFFNPYVEALMYFPTEEVPKLEVKTVVDDLIAAKPKKFLTGYVGAVDSTAHTQLNRLYPVLKTLDAEVKRLIQSYKEKGQDVEVVLVSDHGNIGRFQEGGKEQELNGVEVADVVKRAGMNFVQQLKDNKDVAMPLLALGSWAPVYLKDRKNMKPLIEEFRKEAWFDMAVSVNRNNTSETLMTVITGQGEAKIQYNKAKGLYYYFPTQGNPLHLPTAAQSTQAAPKALNATEAFKASEGTPYPDALFRIVESASERNFDFPDFILTIKDGNFIKNSLGAFAKMYRTHGSLTAASSYGLIASNKRKVPGQVRSKDILPFIGVEAKELFAESVGKHKATGKDALAQVLANYKQGIQTDAKDLSQKRIFRHISKFVADTRPYFLVSEMKSFMDAFKFDPFNDPTGKSLSPMSFDVSKFDVQTMISPEDIGSVTDAVLTSGSVEKLMNDPRVNKVKEKVGLLQDQKTANLDMQHVDLNGGGIMDQIKNYVLPAKRAVMKMYQMPYLLENSIVIQEKPFLPETRDLQFAKQWVSNKEKAVQSFSALTKTNSKAQPSNVQTLLKEAIKEADLEGRIYPTPLTKIYNQKLEDVTIVYVPGIYNAIFDKEIFSLGLSALSDEMGLRVIQPPVESTCGSEVNADIILDYLSKDFKDRTQRGHAAPRYLFVSYSKGAVDTLHAFLKRPSFISTYVKGMIAVAAPLHGSSILNTTDVPFALVSALTETSGPEICKEKTAAKSITPTAMDAFWRKNERALTGLTRYFSVTFESSPEDSHIFMKATKLIGQFDEDNDGVVTVSSSKFPAKLKAVDMGTIHADHLAGILSSRFNQKAFMKGLISSVSELNINDDKNNLNWNTQVILGAANTHYIKDRQYFRLKSPGIVEQIGLEQDHLVEFVPYSNTWELNRQVLPKINDPADSYDVKTKLPQSGLRYDPYNVIDVSKLGDTMAGTKVTPATRQNMPEGIRIDYAHKNMVHFRMDHQFNYESRSPGGLDDNKDFGYITADFNGEKDWALMKSANNSIRMTTLAYRFSPLEFSKMSLKLAVTKDVVGADPVKGKTGKDDSAFQVWFTIRDGRANGDRTTVDAKNDKVFLFGYYFGGSVPGEVRNAGDIFENWYSNKNVVVATLPEAKQLLLNSQDQLGKAQLYQRNLAQDLKRAFPNKNVADFDIVAITIQHDSNDTSSSSEAYFKALDFTAE